jgi:hypothetical protein
MRISFVMLRSLAGSFGNSALQFLFQIVCEPELKVSDLELIPIRPSKCPCHGEFNALGFGCQEFFFVDAFGVGNGCGLLTPPITTDKKWYHKKWFLRYCENGVKKGSIIVCLETATWNESAEESTK